MSARTLQAGGVMTPRLAISLLSWPAAPEQDATVEDRLRWYPSVARWAPSKHNTQPWRFVVRDSTLELWTDPRRALPHSDPLMRELIISCGAALHHVEVAARALGRDFSLELLPEGGFGFLARLTELGDGSPTPRAQALLSAVSRRRTDRGPLDASVLPASLPFELQSAAARTGAWLRLVASEGDRATLAALVERADRQLVRDGRMDHELAQWRRSPADPRPDGVPGDRTRGPRASYRAEFVQRDFSGGGPTFAHDRAGKDEPVVGVLCTPSDGVADWLAAGRALSAVLLEATLAGANASYLNQPVEVPGLRQELRSHLLLAGPAQLVLRLGAGGQVLPTPRRAVEDIRLET
jgi:hypothetical protein